MLIPEENVKDLQEIPENVKNKLEIVPVKWIDKVLEVALETRAAAAARRRGRRSRRSALAAASGAPPRRRGVADALST